MTPTPPAPPAPDEAISFEERNSFYDQAMNGNNPAITRLLDKYGTEWIDKKNGSRYSALLIAAWMGQTDTVALLLERGADIELKNNEGQTALMLAIMNINLDSVTLLLKKGADIAPQDNTGTTALMYAEERKNNGIANADEIVALLQQWPEIHKKQQEQEEQDERERRGTALFQSRLEKLKQKKYSACFSLKK